MVSQAFDHCRISLIALRNYLAAKRGLPNEDEIADPTGILLSGHVDNVVGEDLVREGTATRYRLMQGLRVLFGVAQLQGGFGAYAPGQLERDEPLYGIYETPEEAEAEAIIRIYADPSNQSE